MRALLAISLVLASALPVRHVPTVPLHAKGETIRFAVVGDVGRHPEAVAAAIRGQHAKTPFDAILLVGDNFYYCGVSSARDSKWSLIRDNYSPIGIPIFPILGNHDYGDPTRFKGPCGQPRPQAQVGKEIVPHWNFPSRSYAVAMPFGTIVLIDTMPVALHWTKPFLGSQTADGVVRDLDSALSGSSGWRIVVGHHGIYSAGEHGTGASRDLASMRTLLPLLKRHHVDLYINGHDHYLGLIGDRRAVKRPLFLTSGAGSNVRPLFPRDTAEPPTLFPPDGQKPFLGFAVMEIDARQISIVFYDSDGQRRSERFVMAMKQP